MGFGELGVICIKVDLNILFYKHLNKQIPPGTAAVRGSEQTQFNQEEMMVTVERYFIVHRDNGKNSQKSHLYLERRFVCKVCWFQSSKSIVWSHISVVGVFHYPRNGHSAQRCFFSAHRCLSSVGRPQAVWHWPPLPPPPCSRSPQLQNRETFQEESMIMCQFMPKPLKN